MSSDNYSGLASTVLSGFHALVPIEGQRFVVKKSREVTSRLSAPDNNYSFLDGLGDAGFTTLVQVPFYSFQMAWLQSNCPEIYGNIMKYSELFI
tara:strand:+ start:2077 stop:2358 length:282 start_codon:yes stop_codon:yes gene_type:complete